MRNVFLFLVAMTFLACTSEGEKPADPSSKKAETAAIPPKKIVKAETTKPVAHSKGKALLDAYDAESKGLLKSIAEAPKSKKVQDTSKSLVEKGINLTKLMLEKEPECAPYLNALLKAAPTLGNLSAEDIETGYHQDGKLPKSPKEACYHAKDLVVHPATVLVMAKSVEAVKPVEMKKEIAEVIAHLHHIRAVLE